MTAISVNEFNTYSKKYLDLAVNEDVCIENEKYRYRLIFESVINENIPEQVILKPDDDLRRAIPMEQVRDSVIDYIYKKYEKNI